jgi:hypothetical protein
MNETKVVKTVRVNEKREKSDEGRGHGLPARKNNFKRKVIKTKDNCSRPCNNPESNAAQLINLGEL